MSEVLNMTVLELIEAGVVFNHIFWNIFLMGFSLLLGLILLFHLDKWLGNKRRRS